MEAQKRDEMATDKSIDAFLTAFEDTEEPAGASSTLASTARDNQNMEHCLAQIRRISVVDCKQSAGGERPKFTVGDTSSGNENS